ERARAALKRQGDAAAAARLDVNLGNIHHWSGRPQDALSHYDRALRHARREGDDSTIRMIQMNRGTQLSALGRLGTAEDLFREIVDGAEAAGELRHRAIAQFNLGYIRFQKGDYGSAFDTLDAARRAFEELGDELYLTGTLIDLAELFLEVNDYRGARTTAERARALAERQGLWFEMGRAALFEAVATLAQGACAEARSLFERARESFREKGDTAFQALCDLYLAEVDVRDGDPGTATRRLRSAAKVFRREGLRMQCAVADLALAAVYLDGGKPRPAADALRTAGDYLRRVPAPWLRARLAHLRARLATAEGKPGLARRYFRDAVRHVESIRGRIGIDEFRVSFVDDKAPLYADLVGAVLESGRRDAVAEAFSIVERARSRSLVDLLAGRLGTSDVARDEQTGRLLQRVEELRAEHNRLSGFEGGTPGHRSGLRRERRAADLRACETRISDALRRLQRRHAHLGALTSGETITLDEIQGALSEDHSLVEYFFDGSRPLAFVVRRDGVSVVRLRVSPDDVLRRAAQLRFQMERGAETDDANGTSRAAALLLGVRRHLEFFADEIWNPLEISDRTVTVVPHGGLHSVPLAALPLPGGGAVVDRHCLSFLPSASCRRYLPPPGPVDRKSRLLTLAVGDAGTPAVGREVADIERRFPRSVRLGPEEATREAFRREAENADIIHVATHAAFRGDDPSFSGLQLADGWLSVHDVYGLRLNASLVCLSACQTGLSSVSPGDELVGLSRGFLYAGARALLASLWRIPDSSTADLMAHFYEELAAGEGMAESLRKAMIRAREVREHPFHWAPFVMLGGESPYPG
ncbi:MAG: CHAT domain-containing protein, partial [Gemmatimonadetes bacterium]|nr:CHAT domain-containing protein [Gemmatimonadota bacterium]